MEEDISELVEDKGLDLYRWRRTKVGISIDGGGILVVLISIFLLHLYRSQPLSSSSPEIPNFVLLQLERSPPPWWQVSKVVSSSMLVDPHHH